MKKNIIKCPVPFEQRPLNEYLQLKQAFDFNWTITTPQKFFKNSILLIAIISITCVYLVFSNSTIHDNLTKKIVLSSISSTSILTIVFLRVYLGWNYVYHRLIQATIAYEESGWYDGQIWFKPIKVLKQDRLIFYYKVSPILNRLKKTIIWYLCILVIIFFSSTILW